MTWGRTFLVLLMSWVCLAGAAGANDGGPVPVLRVGDIPVLGYPGDAPLFFVSGMAVDADGAPDAYHPADIGTDALKNAGRPGRWHGIATETGKPTGRPYIQKPGDPNPGYYVSQTSLFDPGRKRSDPARYVNSNTVPYVALPPALLDHVHLGDLVVVVRLADGLRLGAVFADVGPTHRLGEGSIALARALGVPPDPRTGGTHGPVGFLYLLFPGSGNHRPPSPEHIEEKAQALYEQWLKTHPGFSISDGRVIY